MCFSKFDASPSLIALIKCVIEQGRKSLRGRLFHNRDLKINN